MKQFTRCFFVCLIIFATLFGGAMVVLALEDTNFSAGKVVFDNFKWSIGDKLSLSSPQLAITPVSSSSFSIPGTSNIVATWAQESNATFLDFKIALAPGQIAIKYETDKFLSLDATNGLSGKISGSQDIYGPVGVRLKGDITFSGDAYLDLADSTQSRGQGHVEFPIRLSVPLPGFGDCFAYSKATSDVIYQENIVRFTNLVLKNDISTVTGEVAFNLDTEQVKVNLDIISDSKRVKFLMSAVAHLSGFTKLGSGHWKYEFAN